MAQRTLFTIGHSTRGWDEFLSLLRAWKIQAVIDVRTLPRSRAYPWFSLERLRSALPSAGIAYEHMPALGGLKRPAQASPNDGWENLRFRAYADYMQTPRFEEGLAELNHRRRRRRVCIMCSEAVWWRCHRRMIADAETARGIPVRHVMSETQAPLHQITPFAVVTKRRGRTPVITYPAARPPSRNKRRSKRDGGAR